MPDLVWYAETTARRVRQVLADVGMLVWAWLWWRLGRATHDLVAALGAPGRRLESSGDRLASGFRDVADAIAGAPLIGGALGSPFDELADAAGSVAGVGAAQDAAAAALADWLFVLVVLLPVGAVGVVWLLVRVRGARRAATARALRDRGMDDLLALRALATRPLRELLAAADDPAAAWRAGETSALAGLELRRLGLRTRP